MSTIEDVARRAQVSKDTVSRVINNDPTVRPITRKAVLEAIAELDYVPNAAARSLRSSRTRTIGLIVSFLADAVFHPIIAGIEAVVRDHGYSLLICDSNGNPETERANLKTLFERHVEGLIIYPAGDACPPMGRFQQANIPVLVMDWSEPTPGLPQLPLNHRAAIKRAIEYLLGLGHRHIVFFAPESRFGKWRAEDFRQAAGELICSNDPTVAAWTVGPREAAETLRLMLDCPDRPTAVISSSLFMTPSLLRVIQASHLEIPGDVSFITYGDSDLAAVYRPPLTVMVTDRLGRGKVAAEYIFARLAGEEADNMLHEWDVDLLIRESCATAPVLQAQV